jgi:hypothetical protein
MMTLQDLIASVFVDGGVHTMSSLTKRGGVSVSHESTGERTQTPPPSHTHTYANITQGSVITGMDPTAVDPSNVCALPTPHH